MKIGIAVDAACDLPREFLDEHRIAILPVTLRIGAHTLTDNRDPAVTQMFYREHYGQRGQDAETAPLSAAQMRELFLHRLVLDYDVLFALTIAATRSPICRHAQEAAQGIAAASAPLRQQAGVAGPFNVRVIDTQNLFAAQGVTAVEAARLAAKGADPETIAERVEYLARNTYGYMLPRDLHFLHARARHKGELSVGWLSAALGATLDLKPLLCAHRNDTAVAARLRGFEDGVAQLFRFLIRRLDAGLLTPALCLSYGGDLRELDALPGYAELQQQCRERKVTLYVSQMSMTGAINVGEGALAIGFAAEPHGFAT